MSVEGDQTTAGCTVTVACEGETCIACQSVKDNTMHKDIAERAGRSISSENGRSLNYEYMTMKQTEGRAPSATASVESTRLKTLSIQRQALRIGRKLANLKKVMLFLGQNDVCDVRRVLGQALKDGKSPYAILGTLQAAFEGRYHARGHHEDDLDLSILVMRVGSPSLL